MPCCTISSIGVLAVHFPGAQVYDPLVDHTESLQYDDEQGRRVFFDHCRMYNEVDVLIAFVPEASMGTAVEMWQAHQNGRAVITISPLANNWAVLFLSHAVYADMTQFEAALTSGEVARRVNAILEAGDR